MEYQTYHSGPIVSLTSNQLGAACRGQLGSPLCSNAQQHLAPGKILNRQKSGFLGGATLYHQLIIGDINLASRKLRPNKEYANYPRSYSTSVTKPRLGPEGPDS